MLVRSEWRSARLHPEMRPLTVVFVSKWGNPSQLLNGLDDVASRIQWPAGDQQLEVRVPLAGWYLLSAEQLTHPENMYFRLTKPAYWPYADTALFHVPAAGQ